MQILLLSDIHGNLAALDSVLADAESRGVFERCWVLGDTVGYGPQPNECLERVRDLGALVIAGNHEMAALGKLPLEQFNPYAAEAAQWTMERLTSESRTMIEKLPVTVSDEGFTLAHGSPRDPIWEYVLFASQGVELLPYFDTPGCALGHTHQPMVLHVEGTEGSQLTPAAGAVVDLAAERYFVNPGSVGQPRDNDPRASYALLDSEERVAHFHRVEYDIAATQKLMQDAGLPEVLWYRLSLGM